MRSCLVLLLSSMSASIEWPVGTGISYTDFWPERPKAVIVGKKDKNGFQKAVYLHNFATTEILPDAVDSELICDHSITWSTNGDHYSKDNLAELKKEAAYYYSKLGVLDYKDKREEAYKKGLEKSRSMCFDRKGAFLVAELKIEHCLYGKESFYSTVYKRYVIDAGDFSYATRYYCSLLPKKYHTIGGFEFNQGENEKGVFYFSGSRYRGWKVFRYKPGSVHSLLAPIYEIIGNGNFLVDLPKAPPISKLEEIIRVLPGKGKCLIKPKENRVAVEFSCETPKELNILMANHGLRKTLGYGNVWLGYHSCAATAKIGSALSHALHFFGKEMKDYCI